MSNLENLNFELSALNIAGCKMMQAKKKGKFTLEKLKKDMQKISDDLHKSGRTARLGVSLHYKNVNKMAPAIFSNTGQAVTIWNPKDSPESQHLYDGDEIDEVCVFVIKNVDGKADDQKHLKHKKEIKKSDFF
jgi:superfamily II DNA/RNA helicase